MKNINFKSIFLGFGFGLIFTSLICAVYLYNTNLLSYVSEDEILAKAEEIENDRVGRQASGGVLFYGLEGEQDGDISIDSEAGEIRINALTLSTSSSTSLATSIFGSETDDSEGDDSNNPEKSDMIDGNNIDSNNENTNGGASEGVFDIGLNSGADSGTINGSISLPELDTSQRVTGGMSVAKTPAPKPSTTPAPTPTISSIVTPTPIDSAQAATPTPTTANSAPTPTSITTDLTLTLAPATVKPTQATTPKPTNPSRTLTPIVTPTPIRANIASSPTPRATPTPIATPAPIATPTPITRPVTETLQKPAATVTMSTQTPPATTTTATAKPAATATTAPPSPAPTQTNSTQSGGTNGGTQGGQDGSRQPISFEIKSGETASTVANNLYKAGIISSADGFLRAVAARNLTGEIMTGTYSLVPGTDYDTLINTICYIRGSS